MTPNKKCVEEAIKIFTHGSGASKNPVDSFLVAKDMLKQLGKAYLSGELGVMAEVTCPKCRDIGVICKDDPAKAYVCDCQVGKQWKIEPRGAQFRRVEEQQKVIERYRLALEKIVQFKCVDHEFVWEAERDFLKIIDITTTALKGQNGQEV